MLSVGHDAARVKGGAPEPDPGPDPASLVEEKNLLTTAIGPTHGGDSAAIFLLCNALGRYKPAMQAARTFLEDANGRWAAGLETLCRALTTDDDDAERRFLESIDHLKQTRVVASLAHRLEGADRNDPRCACPVRAWG
jgi:hypothetical protein